MACFFDCFGVRNHHRYSPPSSDATNVFVIEGEQRQKMRLSSLFSAEEEQESVVKQREKETLVRRTGGSEELVEEAKFLKACGTLPETPAEIRRRVAIVENLDKSDEQGAHNELNCLPETPVDNQQGDTVANNIERSYLQSAHSGLGSSPETPDEVLNKDIFSENSVEKKAQKPHSVLKSSPYPTPKRITDDMQTPGTVFATNMKSLTKGNGRIRSQYVYTVLNSIENLHHLDELKEENSALDQSDHEVECLSKQENTTSPLKVGSSENSTQGKNLGDVSLSAWLKPPPSKVDVGFTGFKKASFGTLRDRPIIGLVATHWNKPEEDTHISPKPWDGNGIPNSTTKYKEDQKVCWHATPFDERLEKALCEETAVPQRKLVMEAPISFEELESQDTATSQLRSIPKSVVSF
ncbi:unnamed protein product [Amaranthus hypochondriacus]